MPAPGEHRLASWLDAVKPVHPQYAALQKALADLEAEADQAGPNDERVKAIAINLDRWRHLPDDLGDRYILVNIPQYHLFVRERGASVFDMKVIVASPGTTRRFSAAR